jgi:enterochelin esterase family protein
MPSRSRVLAFLVIAYATRVFADDLREEIPLGTLRSPRLVQLWDARRAGAGPAVLARFWQDVARQGTPLLEPIPGDDRHFLVTFLWRGNEATRGVLILGSIAQDARMERLPGTDVWYRSYVLRRDLRFTYRLAPVERDLVLDNKDPRYNKGRIRETAQIDPLNRRRHPPSGDPLLSVAVLPGAPPQPWVARRPGAPAGRVVEDEIRSSVLDGRRWIAIYTPPGYRKDAQTPYPLLVVSDGSAYLDLIPLRVILDNLIAARRIPPVVAVLVGRPEAEERDRDLACYRPYSDFLAGEVLPWVRERYRVTADPARTVVAGSSQGGLAAACAALARPELFGNVLSQSGSFMWRPDGDPAWEWVARQIRARPKLLLRFYLDVGLLEDAPVEKTGPSLLASNRHLRDALQARGYPVWLTEFAGGHGYANWQGTIVDGLSVLLGGKAPAGKSPRTS